MGIRPRPLLGSWDWALWAGLRAGAFLGLNCLPALGALAWAGLLAAGLLLLLCLWFLFLRAGLAAGRRLAPNLARPLLAASSYTGVSAGAP